MTDPRIHERRVVVAREKGRHRRRYLLVGVVIVLLASGGFALVHSSVLGARHVEVSGLGHTSYSAVVKAAGLEGAPPLIDLSTSVIAERVEALPWIDTASVSLSWPTTVHIRLVERTPVAFIRSGSGSWALLDPSGRVLQDVSVKPSRLPFLESSAAASAPGHRSSATLSTLAHVASAMPQSMVREISDVRWGHVQGVVADLSSRRVAILGTPALLHDKFVALATVLAHGDLSGIRTIDLRVPSAPLLLR